MEGCSCIEEILAPRQTNITVKTGTIDMKLQKEMFGKVSNIQQSVWVKAD